MVKTVPYRAWCANAWQIITVARFETVQTRTAEVRGKSRLNVHPLQWIDTVVYPRSSPPTYTRYLVSNVNANRMRALIAASQTSYGA